MRAAPLSDLLLELKYALPCQGTDKQDVTKAFAAEVLCKGLLIGDEIGFVADSEIRDLLFLKELHQFPVCLRGAAPGVDHKDGKVSLIENSLCALHALFAQRSFVIESGCVDDHDRSQRKKLHGLGHGICRCSLDV